MVDITFHASENGVHCPPCIKTILLNGTLPLLCCQQKSGSYSPREAAAQQGLEVLMSPSVRTPHYHHHITSYTPHHQGSTATEPQPVRAKSWDNLTTPKNLRKCLFPSSPAAYTKKRRPLAGGHVATAADVLTSVPITVVAGSKQVSKSCTALATDRDQPTIVASPCQAPCQVSCQVLSQFSKTSVIPLGMQFAPILSPSAADTDVRHEAFRDTDQACRQSPLNNIGDQSGRTSLSDQLHSPLTTAMMQDNITQVYVICM